MSRAGHRGVARPMVASGVPILDSGGYYTATEVESALAEVAQEAARSGSAPNVEGAVGEYWAPPSIRSAAATGAGNLHLKMIYVPRDQAIDRIGVHVTVGAAGATITLGVYEDDGAGNPGVLLFDAGTIDGNSATAQEITIAQTLLGGRRYWLAALVAVGGPTVRMDIGAGGVGWVGRHATFAASVGTSLINQGRLRSGVAGTALPTPAATTALLANMPTIALRLA